MLDDIQKMFDFMERNYPEPKWYWSKAHFKRRCAERLGIEKAICMCADSFENTADVLDSYVFQLDLLISTIHDDGEIKSILLYEVDAIRSMADIFSFNYGGR